jgi:hypothetical protein
MYAILFMWTVVHLERELSDQAGLQVLSLRLIGAGTQVLAIHVSLFLEERLSIARHDTFRIARGVGPAGRVDPTSGASVLLLCRRRASACHQFYALTRHNLDLFQRDALIIPLKSRSRSSLNPATSS